MSHIFSNKKKIFFSKNIIVKHMGLQPYEMIEKSMSNFVKNRKDTSIDEIWLVQHPKIFTYGILSEKEDVLCKNMKIPIIYSPRGGKITYHGPGQQIMYTLLDLRRRKLKISSLVSILEKIVKYTLSVFFIKTHTISNMPGVFVDSKKICSIGLRVKKGYSSYGMALNVKMDLFPFKYINPCGHKLSMVQVYDYFPKIDINKLLSILTFQCFYFFS